MYISLYVFAWTWSQGVFPLHQVSTVVLVLSSGSDKKERAKRNEHVECEKGDNLIIVSTTLLIG